MESCVGWVWINQISMRRDALQENTITMTQIENPLTKARPTCVVVQMDKSHPMQLTYLVSQDVLADTPAAISKGLESQ